MPVLDGSISHDFRQTTFFKFFLFFNFLLLFFLLRNPIQDELFRGMGEGGNKKAPLPKICHAYPTMMKLGTIIPYLKKIQKIY